MIWHPLLLAVFAMDLLTMVLVLFAAITFLRIGQGWHPASASSRQITLEAATDGSSLAMLVATALYFCACLALLVAVSLALPPLVPGAMCGTGVLGAMDGVGQRALVLRVLVLVVLWVGITIDRLNRSQPQPPAVPAVARWFLLCLPLLVLATVLTLQALTNLDPHQPVNCCQAVYAKYATASEATTTLGISDRGWLWLTGSVLLLLLVLLAATLWNLRKTPGSAAGITLATLAVCLLWLPLAGISQVRILSAYHYQVLHHHCPWCLFLPEHHGVGFAIFAALLVLLLESSGAYSAQRLAALHPALTAPARLRSRSAVWRMLLALLVLITVNIVPALLWRFQTGLWIHGS